MKTPWANQTGIAKLISIFATVFLITLGLCGINVVAAISNPYHSGSAGVTYSKFLAFAGGLESGVLLLSFLALLILAIATLIQRLRR